ncbi:NAD(P)-binding protein [Chryseobacterium sp. JV558]|nr:NAD(P)-binding protein [Chryseobacterium sp. JV558]
MNSSNMVPEHSQILVIGGGPAGSSVATLLSKHGFNVTLLEKEIFPRYHIGESLLPSALKIFDLLGVREKVENYGFVKKEGAYVKWGKDNWTVDFNALGENKTYSFQVRRAEFDHLLLDHSSSVGVNVVQGIIVEKVKFTNERATSLIWQNSKDSSKKGEISFDYLIDASGRSGIIATKHNKDRKIHEDFQNVAAWGYWENVDVPDNFPKGAIATTATSKGWFWSIPVKERTMSIGIVLHKDEFKRNSLELKEFYMKRIKEDSFTGEITKNGTFCGEVKVEQDYSYSAKDFCGPGYFICGDAACFIDPLLSSGVHLGMFSALMCAASLTSILKGEATEAEGMSYYQKCYKKAYLRMMVFVSSFYNQYEGMESQFWKAKKMINSNIDQHDIKYAFTSLIAGLEDLNDVESKVDNVVYQEMLKKVKQKTENAKIFANTQENKESDTVVSDPDGGFFAQKIEGYFAFDKEEAIEGFYISTEGGVQLSRV